MAANGKRRADRYDVPGNPEAEHVDPAKRVMVNLKGITSLREVQRLEAERLAQAYGRLLGEVRTDTPMTCELLRHINAVIFGDVYAWAGRWRTVRISKPGAAWPPPDFLAQGMEQFEQRTLRMYPASSLRSDDAFCAAAAEIQGEFLSIHPFREGNARSIKLMTDLLASQTGRPLLVYDVSQEGIDRYIAAAKKALREGDHSAFETIIGEALARALRPA